ncbi:penicillin-binding protein [Devosia pacifica]|uniref:Penicillin-binding protein n=1 Tax=Devosia pacifica TaxID=1335967 RepID=A0A918S6E5_9HYPH|nr:transglycosylase domain-containing protein [Devosia pacifica]GHA22779.1 penicillin-binding protein [Devosia pacifica]
MDFRISPEDRVGGQQGKRGASKSGRRRKGERVEPSLGTGVGAFVDDERSGGVAPVLPTGDAQPNPRKSKKAEKSRKGSERSTRGGGGGNGKPPKRKRRGAGGFFVGIVYFLFMGGLVAGLAAMGLVVYFGMQLPDSNSWAVPERPPNIRVLAADGRLISNRGQTGGEAISYHELPYYVPAAIIASEDRRFMSHMGVDPVGLAAVLVETLRAGEITRGASTITQQVAKNLFLSPDQTLGRKVQEAVLAVWLEQNYTKEQILELYFNRVYYGQGATGIEAAAQTYYGISARDLSLGQAATLAGILPAPSAYNPKSAPDIAARRQALVLNAMVEEGYVTREEADAAEANPDRSAPSRVAGSEYYVADWVETLMNDYLGEVDEDVVVHTTLDWDLQKHAEFVVREKVAEEGGNRGFSQAALVSMDTTGTVRALIGGVDYNKSQYNRAVTARRQPGSAFKPFVYTAAMEKGYTPDTLAEDAQFTYNGWSPGNATGRYVGTVTLRQGLAYSLNTIAARLAIDVTPQSVIDVATRMGISTPMEAVPSIALGTQEVSLLELTSAYVPFANGGVGVIPNVISSIETVDGEVLYQASDAGPGRVLAPEIVAEMNDMLKTAVEVGTGRGANLNGWPFAGKTGTSQNAKDAVFVGYTADMVTGVWLGNDDASGTTLSGGNVPVAIWSEYMTRAHQGLEVAQLPGYGDGSSTLVAEQILDPNTGQPMIDPQTGQPMVQFIDPTTGQVIQPQIDAGTGQLVPQTAQIDPNTGQPVTGEAQQQIDPNTGYPVQQQPAQQPLDPMTGQQIPPQQVATEPQWNPNAAEPTPQQSPRAQRTLMDMIFGN